MRKTLLSVAAAIILAATMVGCSGITKILKEGKPDEIYSKAIELYELEKWDKASTLFEASQVYYTNTPREDSLAYYNAMCKFRGRDYESAALLFDDFRQKFGRSPFLEEAEASYVFCFYYLSPGPTRDQTQTSRTRLAIYEFLDRFPESKAVPTFQEMDAELLIRLHDKSYINAHTYYKIGRYSSAITALKNALKEYPESGRREELMYLVVASSYELASNSIASKQTDRYLSMLDSYYSFVSEFPESTHRKEVDRMADAAKKYLDKNRKDNN